MEHQAFACIEHMEEVKSERSSWEIHVNALMVHGTKIYRRRMLLVYTSCMGMWMIDSGSLPIQELQWKHEETCFGLSQILEIKSKLGRHLLHWSFFLTLLFTYFLVKLTLKVV